MRRRGGSLRVRLREGYERVRSREDKLWSLGTYGWAYRGRENYSWIDEIKDLKRKKEKVRNSFSFL